MDNSIYAALTGSMAQMKRLDHLANNLANANTAGFKTDRPVFEEFNTPMPQEDLDTLDPGARPEEMLTGARPRRIQYTQCTGTFTDHSPGPLNHTGATFDMAIEGKGFFAVETPWGERYTRNGAFSLSSDGDLVTDQGHAVLDSGGGRINLTGTDEVQIDSTGAIFQGGQEAGTLRIVDFDDLQALEKEGASFFVYRGTRGPVEPEETRVAQGYLEHSNVNTVKGLVTMVEVTRRYEAYQKVIGFLKSAESRLINEVGRVG